MAASAVATNFEMGISQPASAVQEATDPLDAVRLHLIANRSAYLAGNTASTVDWVIQNALIAEQATFFVIGGSLYRDQCMASNIDWILQQNPGAKVVVSAHDAHVERAAGAMGSYLAANHGADYVVFGQIFHAGQYSAVDSSGALTVSDATVSFPGTVEYVFHTTGMPQFILDMRQASPTDPGSSWLFGTTQYRWIGDMAADGFVFTNQLTTDYDALIFFDQTTATHALPPN